MQTETASLSDRITLPRLKPGRAKPFATAKAAERELKYRPEGARVEAVVGGFVVAIDWPQLGWTTFYGRANTRQEYSL